MLIPELATRALRRLRVIDLHDADAALGQAAATIRGFRPPEPYGGKGVRYRGENILRKTGKAGKK